tara:strand:+ start:1823 stop:2830 length:1008 start_codon:yes stop_codon:yes gene_type:complete
MVEINIGSEEWLSQVQEEIVEPDIPIIDPHHHLWNDRGSTYLVEQLQNDTSSGHQVLKTVYMECGWAYREGGPKHLKVVGETEAVFEQAQKSKETGGAVISAIVSRADLRLGDEIVEVLEAHEEASRGLFRGIRHAGARAEYPEVLTIPGGAPKGLFQDEDFLKGMRALGRNDYTYDTWHYHYQNGEFAEMVKKVPDTKIVLDHFGTPLGVGPYADKREEIFQQWKLDINEISKSENVFMKIGGMAMPDNGFGWNNRDKPATSDEFVEAQRRYYLHAIDCFGPERCMMESNFPVDRMSLSYHVLYNGLKKIVADFSYDEKVQMFYKTAENIYKVD